MCQFSGANATLASKDESTMQQNPLDWTYGVYDKD